MPLLSSIINYFTKISNPSQQVNENEKKCKFGHAFSKKPGLNSTTKTNVFAKVFFEKISSAYQFLSTGINNILEKIHHFFSNISNKFHSNKDELNERIQNVKDAVLSQTSSSKSSNEDFSKQFFKVKKFIESDPQLAEKYRECLEKDKRSDPGLILPEPTMAEEIITGNAIADDWAKEQRKAAYNEDLRIWIINFLNRHEDFARQLRANLKDAPDWIKKPPEALEYNK